LEITMRSRILILLCCAISAMNVASVTAQEQSAFLPMTNHRDHVYNRHSGYLFISTSLGDIRRYDVAHNTWLPDLHIGASLNGLDITPDGANLYVTETQIGVGVGYVRKVNPLTGAQQLVTFSLAHTDGGSWDIVVLSNNRALFTTLQSGSGGRVPLQQINLITNVASERPDVPGSFTGVVTGTRLYRGAGRGLAFAVEPVASEGPIFTYDPLTDAYPAGAYVSAFLQSNESAVNRDGTLIAFEYAGAVSVMNRFLGTVQVLIGINGGLIFSPAQDILYGVADGSDQIVAINTESWAELYRIPIGENLTESTPFGSGTMSMTTDGRRLFLSTPTGIRVYTVPNPGVEDCNSNGVVDACDLNCGAQNAVNEFPCTIGATCGTSADCNSNGIPDECEPDCNNNSLPDEWELAEGSGTDCDGNAIPDDCEPDCNSNGVADTCDIRAGISSDCSIQDQVVLADAFADAALSSAKWYTVSDAATATSLYRSAPRALDLDGVDYVESVPLYLRGASSAMLTFYYYNVSTETGDDLEIEYDRGAGWTVLRTCLASANATAWQQVQQALPSEALSTGVRLRFRSSCDNLNDDWYLDDISLSARLGNGIPDTCEPDCNGNALADACDIANLLSADCNSNGLPDECDVTSGAAYDCNTNGILDECEEIFVDCNSNGVLDACEIIGGLVADCNYNGAPDDCDIASGVAIDCNTNGFIDSCETAAGHDCCTAQHGMGCSDSVIANCICNIDPYCCNVYWDRVCSELVEDEGCGSCSMVDDCNHNAIPDMCEADCNRNSVADDCDITHGTSSDCQHDGIPDDCQPDFDGDRSPDDCDPDDDGDLVQDVVDVCPFTPIGLATNNLGRPLGDRDSDCDIDVGDSVFATACLESSGPGRNPGIANCLPVFDFDADLDVDLKDLARFYVAASVR
jgi:hypothetical protein